MNTDRPEMPSRREWLRLLAGMPLAAVAACSSNNPYSHITGGIAGANHKVGHLLRDGAAIPAPDEYMEREIVIAGAGVSGLSAARWLGRKGHDDILLLEMGERTGGNAVWGQNKASAYPWGAHYLPVPDVADEELATFLQAAGVITGYRNGLPVFNEYHLCHDPEERLFIHGHWQEGLLPHFGVPGPDRQQIAGFMQHVAALKEEKGTDGKYAFSIPLDTSSADERWRSLDTITFAQYLKERGYTSAYLLWYLNYCCKDDYGMGIEHTSAWAGLHYFAARRGRAANADHSSILTWPQGNGFLADALKAQCGNTEIKTGVLLYRVLPHADYVELHCLMPDTGKSFGIRAKKVLLSSPRYVNKHLLAGDISNHISGQASYAPWVVANITFSSLPQGRGTALCWDNVIYGRDSVGYVYANHQSLTPPVGKGVITWYLPIQAGSDRDARMQVYNRTWNDWVKVIMEDLSIAHRDIHRFVENIDVWVWGHGMIQPVPGYIWGRERAAAMRPVNDRIFFAHSDLSGISIFEEAFHQGIRAAKELSGMS